MDAIRIYVGTYAKYNSGNLAGAWLDIEDYADKEDFEEACAALHPDESDPEFMFQDMEGVPEGMAGESFVKDELFEYAALDEDDREMLSVYRDGVNQEGDLEEARDAFMGKANNEADFAAEYHEEAGTDLGPLANYIDWESVARDMRCDGVTFVRHEGQVWAFSG